MPTDATQKVLPSPSRQFDAPERRRDTRRGLLPPSPLPLFSTNPTQHKKRDMKVVFLVLAPFVASVTCRIHTPSSCSALFNATRRALPPCHVLLYSTRRGGHYPLVMFCSIQRDEEGITPSSRSALCNATRRVLPPRYVLLYSTRRGGYYPPCRVLLYSVPTLRRTHVRQYLDKINCI